MALNRRKSLIDNLIAEIRNRDPKLYEALSYLSDDIQSIVDTLEPLEKARASSQAAATNPPNDVTGLNASLATRESIVLSWNAATGASFYEVRIGSVWETASYVLRTSNTGAVLDPVVAGSYTYLVKGISASGVYSVNAASKLVVVGGVGTFNLTANVIDNNVLLYWTEPSATWWIDYYEVWKTVSSVRSKVGEVTGLFTALFEQSGGVYLYEIIPFDIAGNSGTPVTVEVTVSNPPDYDAVGEIAQDNSLATLTAAIFEAATGRIYCPVDITELFNAHFTTPSWGGPSATPQDQVTAGYEIWVQENPTGTPAAVIEFPEVDFGASYNNVIASFAYGFTYLTSPNQPTVTLYIKSSNTPGGGSYVAGNNQFITGPVRYFRVKLEINNASDDSMMYIEDGSVLALDVKREVDSNNIACSSGDSGGTTVYTDGLHDASLGHSRKAFKSIDSITLTSKAQEANKGEPLTFIFDDTNSPTSFTIYVFDGSGQRVSQQVDWKVRGIV